ncbi:MAG: polyphosphate kinase 1 [Saprospiraceae bacterium]|nr:polyphosphate kinase 1 [Saprospiraceae bacterium]
MNDLYTHRDISWLDFNYRVLQEAKDKNVPLFERIKFLAIYSSNLDEYFRVRVANHRSLVRAGKSAQKELDYEASEILEAILHIVNEQQLEFSRIFEREIIPDLKRNNIFILRRDKLSKDQIHNIENYFKDFMLPYAQPVLLVGNKVKPFLNNNALYLALHLRDRENHQTHYAIVKVPSDHLPRFLELPNKSREKHELLILGDVVRHNISLIFPGYDILDSYSIKLTRDAELYIDDEFSGNLLDKIKKSLNQRNIGQASRLVYDRTMPKHMLDFLMSVFDLSSYDLLPEGRYHNNADFFKFPTYEMQHLKDPVLPPLPVPQLEEADNIFDVIAKKDYFIHVPYHRYEAVIKFFEDAAVDPNVTHIKVIQYRVAKVSRIMDALRKAVVNGKQVSTFIEVKARFDEETNLMWGEKLSLGGVNVYYSMPGYKVHSKMAIVRRIEKGTPKIYAYCSTGNFHENTAKLYSDVGLFTADVRITSEATRVFSFLETKKRPENEFEHLGVGLFNLKEKFVSLVRQEIQNARLGKKARMILKMNNLEQKDMIDLLYEANDAGVETNLIIRSVCSIVTGKKGLSENIHAISIVDRFLEHSRIFYFYNDGQEDIFISSADWMERNLHFRVETLIPIYDPKIKEIFKTILQIQLHDNVKSRSLDFEKINTYVTSNNDLAVRSQIETYYYVKRVTEQQDDPNATKPEKAAGKVITKKVKTKNSKS